MWSLSVPEMIGTSDGFVFGFDVPERWQPAGGGGDSVEYAAESRPLGPDFDRACFAGPDHLIDRDGLVRYRAEIGVGSDLVEIALHITNLSATATTFFSHVCCRFHGRGLVWGWREQTLVSVEGRWIPADRLLRGDGYPPARHWFLPGNCPGRAFMEMFRPGSPDDERTQVITSPWIAMPMQDTRYTTIYGSPQAGMLFVKPGQPLPAQRRREPRSRSRGHRRAAHLPRRVRAAARRSARRARVENRQGACPGLRSHPRRVVRSRDHAPEARRRRSRRGTRQRRRTPASGGAQHPLSRRGTG